MRIIIAFIAFNLFGVFCSVHAQTGVVKGEIMVDGAPVEYAQVQLEGTMMGALTNVQGAFIVSEIPFGTYTIVA